VNSLLPEDNGCEGHVCQNWTLQHTLNSPLYGKYCTGMYRTESRCTNEGLNKSVCQALLNIDQPLLPVETCTRTRTPVWRLMPIYWTCRTRARPDYRDCTVYTNLHQLVIYINAYSFIQNKFLYSDVSVETKMNRAIDHGAYFRPLHESKL
jgi:hypothetical protein